MITGNNYPCVLLRNNIPKNIIEGRGCFTLFMRRVLYQVYFVPVYLMMISKLKLNDFLLFFVIPSRMGFK